MRELRKRGMRVWFDETDMSGNILDSMARGIETADVVLVFVTRNYARKAASEDAHDNVRREFMFASARPEKLLMIRFDDIPLPLPGAIGMVLSHELYVDLRFAAEPSDGQIDALVDAVRKKTGKAATPTKHPSRPAPQLRRTPAAASHKERVDQLMCVVGRKAWTGHMGIHVDQMLQTLFGSDHKWRDAPFVEKLAVLERQLM